MPCRDHTQGGGRGRQTERWGEIIRISRKVGSNKIKNMSRHLFLEWFGVIFQNTDYIAVVFYQSILEQSKTFQEKTFQSDRTCIWYVEKRFVQLGEYTKIISSNYMYS